MRRFRGQDDYLKSHERTPVPVCLWLCFFNGLPSNPVCIIMPFNRIFSLLFLPALSVAWSCNAHGQKAQETEATAEIALETAVAIEKYQVIVQERQAFADANPNNPEAYLDLSRAYKTVGRYTDAEAQARRAVEIGGSSEAFAVVGELLYLQGKYGDAETQLKQATGPINGLPAAYLYLGRLYRETGRKTEAEAQFEHIVRLFRQGRVHGAEGAAATALASKYLERFHDANNLFMEATRLPGNQLDVYVAWGNLFLEKYNRKDATVTFEDALEIDPSYPPALAGLAEALSETRTSLAEKRALQALNINPSLVEARQLLARLYLDDEQYDNAVEQLEKALKVNPESTATRSLLAACYNAMGKQDAFHEEVRRVMDTNPQYGQLFATIADNLSRRYRFVEAIEMGRKAIKTDPSLWTAYASLGVNLSRVGKETEARRHLDTSFEGDSFNLYTLNTLNLFDAINEYTTRTSDNFILKLDKDEDPVFGKLALDLLEQAHRTISPRYGFEPERPILVEIFPEHSDFAVRISGLPGAGALLGVCFGEVIVADSPKARPVGSFNWGQTLWHEFAHVIHLQLTRNRIPRWLAEGIAVYEARIARPEWDIDLDLEFAKAAERGDLLAIGDLNSGFTRPKSAEQVILSYYQASMVVEFIVEKYGFGAIRTMLSHYRDDQNTTQVIEDTFDITFEEFDAAFASYTDDITADTRLATRFTVSPGKTWSEEDLRMKIEMQPGSFYAHLHLGRVLMAKEKYKDAIEMLKKARELLPAYVHTGNPYRLLADIYKKTGNVAGRIRELEALTSIDEDNIEGCKELAQIYDDRRQDHELIGILSRATMINPFDSKVRNMLGTAFERQERFNEAIIEFQAALKVETTDMAAAHYNLSRVYLAAGRNSEAKRSALAALKIAPNFEAAQEILLNSLE